jgi:hypothetical protein
MRLLQLVIRLLEPPLCRLELAVRRLEPLILRRHPIELAAEPLELFSINGGTIVGWGLVIGIGRERALGRVRDQEGFFALLAADLPADISPPDAERGPTGRAGHLDPFHLVGRVDGRLAGPGGARRRTLLGDEGLVALLAADLLADIGPPDLETG